MSVPVPNDMTEWLLYGAAYLVLAFVLSALWVRFLPDGWVAQQIRLRLGLFAVLPLLVVYSILSRIFGLLRIGSDIPRRFFERIAGRELYTKSQHYGNYSRGRPRRGTSQKPSRQRQKPRTD